MMIDPKDRDGEIPGKTALRQDCNGVPDEQLACLNSWPEGTLGYQHDQQLISLLNTLCKRHGYGHVGHLAAGIEEIWRDPEAGTKKWQAFRNDRISGLIETMGTDAGTGSPEDGH